MKRYAKSCRFTLIELLVVIGIILILMGLLLPVASFFKTRTFRADDLNNLRQFTMGCLAYANDHRGIIAPGCRESGLANTQPAGVSPGGWNGVNGDDIWWFNGKTWDELRDTYGVSAGSAGCICPRNAPTSWRSVVTERDGDGRPIKSEMQEVTGRDAWAAQVEARKNHHSDGWGYFLDWVYYANRGTSGDAGFIVGTPDHRANYRQNGSYGGLPGGTADGRYYLPNTLQGKMGSLAFISCLARGDGGNVYGGMMAHMPPNDVYGSAVSPASEGGRGTFNGQFHKMAGLNMGFVDGAAAWVLTKHMAAFELVGYMYYDTTRL